LSHCRLTFCFWFFVFVACRHQNGNKARTQFLREEITINNTNMPSGIGRKRKHRTPQGKEAFARHRELNRGSSIDERTPSVPAPAFSPQATVRDPNCDKENEPVSGNNAFCSPEGASIAGRQLFGTSTNAGDSCSVDKASGSDSCSFVISTDPLKIQESIQKLLDTIVDDDNSKVQMLEGVLSKYGSSMTAATMTTTTSPPSEPTTTPAPSTPVITFLGQAVTPTPCNPKIFDEKKNSDQMRNNPNAGKVAKSKALRKVQGILDQVGNDVRQLAVIVGLLKRERNAPLAAGLLSAIPKTDEERAASQLLRRMKEMLKHTVKRRDNDSRTFVRTLFFAMAPKIVNDKVEGMRPSHLASALGLGTRIVKQLVRRAAIARNHWDTNEANNNVNSLPLVQHFKRSSTSRFTKEYVKQLHDFILNDCDSVIASPNKDHTVRVRNITTGEWEQKPKFFYRFSIRELHNEIADKFPLAKGADGELLIGDTTLRELLPRQLGKLTEKHKEMCGCEDCIEPRGLTTTLIAWRTKRLNDLKKKVNTAKVEAVKQTLQERLDEYQKEAFKPDGSPLWSNAKEAFMSMTCAPVGEDGLHRLECVLGRCKNCPKFFIPEQEKGKDPVLDTKISFNVYEYYTRCSVHGTVGQAMTCPMCEAEKQKAKEEAEKAKAKEEERKAKEKKKAEKKKKGGKGKNSKKANGASTRKSQQKENKEDENTAEQNPNKKDDNTAKDNKDGEEDQKNGEGENGKKKAKLSRKKRLRLRREPIGVFMEEHYLPSLEKCRCHLLLVALLGKHHCASMRKNVAKTPNTGNVLTQRDYADHLAAEFNGAIQSEHFGEHVTVSMEGVVCWHVKQGEDESFVDVCDYHSYISDDNQQDARTSSINTEFMIQKLRSQGVGMLVADKSVLYELMDGCAKQYRSGTALYLMTVIACKYGIILDRMISAPHHGKGPCDSQGGVDKTYIKLYMLVVGTPEDPLSVHLMPAHEIGLDGLQDSFANRCVILLSDPKRCFGHQKGAGKKHQKRENAAVIDSRWCKAVHHDTAKTDTEANSTMPLKGTTYQCKSSCFPKKSGTKRNGLKDHYHICACPELGLGKVAVRRIPCACDTCVSQLASPWDKKLDAANQARFATPVGCKYSDVLGNLNEWKIVELLPAKNSYDPNDLGEIFDSALDEWSTAAMEEIEVGNMGAYQTNDPNTPGCHVVRWTSSHCTLQEDAMVEGCGASGAGLMPAGTVVCEGVYWYKVTGTTNWYCPPQIVTNDDKKLFRVRCITNPKLQTHSLEEATLPQGLNKRIKERTTRLKARMVTKESHDKTMSESARRAVFEYPDELLDDDVMEPDDDDIYEDMDEEEIEIDENEDD